MNLKAQLKYNAEKIYLNYITAISKILKMHVLHEK